MLFRSLYENFVQFQSSQISEIEFSDDAVMIELEGNVIVTTIDSSIISDGVETLTNSPTEKEMSNMISEILEGMELELR